MDDGADEHPGQKRGPDGERELDRRDDGGMERAHQRPPLRQMRIAAGTASAAHTSTIRMLCSVMSLLDDRRCSGSSASTITLTRRYGNGENLLDRNTAHLGNAHHMMHRHLAPPTNRRVVDSQRRGRLRRTACRSNDVLDSERRCLAHARMVTSAHALCQAGIMPSLTFW